MRRALGRRSATRTVTAVLAVAAALRLIYGPPHLGYDAWFALDWGNDIAHLRMPDFTASIAPTPHPLANVVSAALSALGDAAPTAVATVSVLSLAGLVVAVGTLGRRLFGTAAAIVAVGLLVTRPLLVMEALYCSVDIPFLALVAAASCTLVRDPSRHARVLAPLVLAGLLRPEGWLLAAVYAAWRWATDRSARRMGLVALVLAAPALWMAFDGIVTGDALHSLHGTRDLADELDRPRGEGTALAVAPGYLKAIVGEPVAWVGAAAGLAAVWLALDRAAVPLALLALGIAAFVVLGLASLPLLYRYLLLSGLGLMLLCGYGASAWARDGPARRRVPLALLAVGVLAAIGASAPSDVRRLHGVVAGASLRHRIEVGLQHVVREPAVRAAWAACREAQVPQHRPSPELAYLLDAPLRDVTVPGATSAGRGLLLQPTPGPIASSFVLTPASPPTFSTAQLARATRIATTDTWQAFRAC
ncbi:MAG TPA: hypothetical protein VHB30_06700 [Solirubrobacteraceae bacterium]|nr:hypothetical protein [Solirubrobacteraceae bacterium]